MISLVTEDPQLQVRDDKTFIRPGNGTIIYDIPKSIIEKPYISKINVVFGKCDLNGFKIQMKFLSG